MKHELISCLYLSLILKIHDCVYANLKSEKKNPNSKTLLDRGLSDKGYSTMSRAIRHISEKKTGQFLPEILLVQKCNKALAP